VAQRGRTDQVKDSRRPSGRRESAHTKSGRQRYVAGPLPSRLRNDYFFPFLPFLFFFLLFLLFLATPITPPPDRKVNEMLTEKRQRIIDRYRVSNTL
jgi:hypothetical protein